MSALRTLRAASMLAVATALLGGCVDDGTGTIGSAHVAEDAGPPKQDAGQPKVLCRLTGGGQIEAGDEPDSFGGNAQPFRDGTFGTHWNHVTHDDGHLIGVVDDIIECLTVPGDPAAPPSAPANAIRFSGTGTFGGEEGCEFEVYIEDHGEPSRNGMGAGTNDLYEIDIVCPSGATYSAGDTILHGNLQIHAVPPGHLPG